MEPKLCGSTTQQRGEGPDRIPALDGIRGVAVLLVFVAHTHLGPERCGALGVLVFFFLSGYLITTLLAREHAAAGRISFQAFYKRRAWRILPPMYLTLGVMIAAAYVGPLRGPISPAVTMVFAAFLANYCIIKIGRTGNPPGSGLLWSLAVEEHFYLLYPAVFTFLAKRPRRLALIGAACLAVLVWRCYLGGMLHVARPRLNLATDTRIDSILMGCALALATQATPIRAAASLSARQMVTLLAAGLCVAGITFATSDSFFFTCGLTIVGLALTPIFALAVRHPGSVAFRWLDSPALRALGLRSYSFYLIHNMIIPMLEASHLGWSRPSQAAAAFLISYLYAEAMYRVVERPTARFRRRAGARQSLPRADGAMVLTPVR